MPAPSPFRKYTAAFVAVVMLGSSAATAAPAVAPRMVDPLAVVGVFGTSESLAAVCAGSSAAAAAGVATAAAGQAPAPGTGCVLPVVDAPPPPVAEPAPPAAIAPVVPPSGGLAILPLLIGLATLAGIAAVILKSDDDGEIVLPISP